MLNRVFWVLRFRLYSAFVFTGVAAGVAAIGITGTTATVTTIGVGTAVYGGLAYGAYKGVKAMSADKSQPKLLSGPSSTKAVESQANEEAKAIQEASANLAKEKAKNERLRKTKRVFTNPLAEKEEGEVKRTLLGGI